MKQFWKDWRRKGFKKSETIFGYYTRKTKRNMGERFMVLQDKRKPKTQRTHKYYLGQIILGPIIPILYTIECLTISLASTQQMLLAHHSPLMTTKNVSRHCKMSPAAAAKSLQSCPTLCDTIDGSPPGSPSLGFSRHEHWSGLPFPSPMHESEK